MRRPCRLRKATSCPGPRPLCGERLPGSYIRGVPTALNDRFETLFGERRGSGRDERESLYHRVEVRHGRESWHRYPGGPRHRLDGPAQIIYLHDGGVEECWFRDGELYRADGGPVFVCRRADGEAVEQYWYRDGQYCSTPAPPQPPAGRAGSLPERERRRQLHQTQKHPHDHIPSTIDLWDGPAESCTRSCQVR